MIGSASNLSLDSRFGDRRICIGLIERQDHFTGNPTNQGLPEISEIVIKTNGRNDVEEEAWTKYFCCGMYGN
jgi:hypothetical protein